MLGHGEERLRLHVLALSDWEHSMSNVWFSHKEIILKSSFLAKSNDLAGTTVV